MQDDEVGGAVEPTEEPPPNPAPPLPPAVTSDADELRKLVDAGASTPEELRALAERIREHKALEESLWRSEVRPTLIKSKKKRPQLSDLLDRPERSPDVNMLGRVAFICVVALILVMAAAEASVLFILLPVVGVAVYAYVQGRKAQNEEDTPAEPPPEAPSD